MRTPASARRISTGGLLVDDSCEVSIPGEDRLAVDTHKDCTYVGNIPKVLVLTIQGKDTKTVSLGATAGRELGCRRAAYPCSPTLVRRSYASVLKG
jgi:hypothetical protein